MDLHEYQAKRLLKDNGVAVPQGDVAESPEQAAQIAENIGGESWMVKAQILSGGRGQGHFKGDEMKSGVRSAASHTHVLTHARSMLGRALITAQTGQDGLLVNQVYIEKAMEPSQELSLSLVLDEANKSLMLLLSAHGGMGMEEMAEKQPSSVTRLPVSMLHGIDQQLLNNTIEDYQLGKQASESFKALVDQVVTITMDNDLTLLEINPVGIVDDQCVALDAKITVDDNSLFRQSEIREVDERIDRDDIRRRASKDGFNFIQLKGDIACMTVGAGLSMATLDSLIHFSGSPANFLDLPPDSKVNRVTSALELLLSNPNVKCLLINVFGGGIMRCDTVSDAIQVVNKLKPIKVPIVVRLAGTNAKLANRRLKEGVPGIVLASNLAEAAQLAVEIARKPSDSSDASESQEGWLKKVINKVSH
ncbi:MAG: ADP-forming succinate--CoA ligase subunit beta [bacterium]